MGKNYGISEFLTGTAIIVDRTVGKWRNDDQSVFCTSRPIFEDSRPDFFHLTFHLFSNRGLLELLSAASSSAVRVQAGIRFSRG